MEKMSGTFMSKVFEGPYKDAGKWAKDMEKYVRSKEKIPKSCISFIQHARNAQSITVKTYTGTSSKDQIMVIERFDG